MVESKKIVKGFAWTAFTQGGNVFFKFISLICLSRLLSPHEYGLIGIIMIFIEIGYMISESGMGASLIRKKDCKHIDYDTLFVYNVSVCLIIYFVLWVSAPYIASFYNQSILTNLIRVASLQILVHTLYAPQSIQLLKELDFRSIAIATLLASSGSLLIAIILAYNNYGVWALVAQFLSEAIILLLYYAIRNRYVPKIRFSKESFREQFSFGINLLCSNLLNTISNNIYNNVVAKVVNIRFAGYFVQANRIQNLPVSLTNSVIDRALFPILSKTNDSKEFNHVYFRVYGTIMMAVCFLSIFLLFFAHDLIYCILGEKWLDATDILRVLALAIVPLTIQSTCRNALKSQGHTFSILKNQIIKSIILIGVLFASSPLGFWYIIAGIVISQIVVTISILRLLSRFGQLSLVQHILIIVPFLLCSLVSVSITHGVLWLYPCGIIYVRIILEVILSAIVYLLMLMLIKNKYCINVISIIRR